MKEKIKAALQQGYKNLGLSDEVFERVAEAAQTFIKEESDIATFVEGAKPMLQMYQSAVDKVRGELNEKIKKIEGEKADLEAKLNGKEKKPDEEIEPKDEKPDMAKLIEAAVAKAIKPISDELTQFKGEQAAKASVSQAETAFMSNDYVKKYKDEATDAWDRAKEMYDATGKKWTAEELQKKAMGYFNKAVGKKGVDTTKPFTNDGTGKETPDFSKEVEILKGAGIDLPDQPDCKTKIKKG